MRMTVESDYGLLAQACSDSGLAVVSRNAESDEFKSAVVFSGLGFMVGSLAPTGLHGKATLTLDLHHNTMQKFVDVLEWLRDCGHRVL